MARLADWLGRFLLAAVAMRFCDIPQAIGFFTLRPPGRYKLFTRPVTNHGDDYLSVAWFEEGLKPIPATVVLFMYHTSAKYRPETKTDVSSLLSS